jgi:hypothetical protein
MWELRCLTTLWASTTCYRDKFTFNVLDNQEALELNGTNQLVAHADDINLLGENINTVTCQRIARQRLDKHPAIHTCSNRMNVYSSLLGNSQRTNGLAR